MPSGVRSLKDLIQYIKDDPRESPPYYDTCTTFESALARPGLNSEEYLESKERLDRSKEYIETELQKHSCQAFVMLSAVTSIWSDAGWPQVTVPMGFLGSDTTITSAQVTDKHGNTVDAPLKLFNTHPNQYVGARYLLGHFS